MNPSIGTFDVVVFLLFVISVIAIGLWKSRDEDNEKDAQDYFLAGRGLTWWLVGFSLIAANISTEQFVGMSGKAADWLGMAIASYEWMAAVTLVVVAFVFLPKFLKSGIYTIPEFLEYRYNTFARSVMAVATLIILVGVPTASVIFSGAKVITVFFQGSTFLGLDLGNITVGCWIIGVLAAVYVFAGGLKACAWADLIQGAALVLGGVIVAYLAFQALGNAEPEELILTKRNDTVTVEQLAEASSVERFFALNEGPVPEGKLHMKRPIDDKEIPWSALLLGLWIPNFFYWGLNQYITQRTLGSRSLAEGQKGIVFAAFLKLVIPFVVVIPGILAFNLYGSDLNDAAITKNAKTLAAYAPELYDSLPAHMKPDPENKRNANDLKAIETRLENARERKTDEISVFGFSDVFAGDHPEEARLIADFNAAALGADALAAEIQAGELSAANKEMVEAAKQDKSKALNVKELSLRDYDAAFPVLLKNLLKPGAGVLGFVLAAIFGAVVSSLASMLNSASTIATMDIYRKFRGETTASELVSVGRVFVVLFVLIAMLIAPMLDDPAFDGIFTFIQEFQGFISPGVLGIFLFGLLIPWAPRMCGTVGLVMSPVLYGLFKFGKDIPGANLIPGITEPVKVGWKAVVDWSFLDRMSLTFILVLAVLTVITIVKPLRKPVELPVNESMDVTSSKGALTAGYICIGLTAVLYYVFW
ncbi:sodium:solute symporter family transporter [Aeoliella mucimassa]|uniref:Sodium/glucose cotransporter n=1 Tax=Aeoliella mucimassa TaxID=2527972 RepID=A0A518AH35_9BACT|nr:sodium/solute symporter [Aeoliella mucimassa]QDU54014.1 Sodium/glucose cotransporter [Aeoliella mucimassa]